MQKKGGKRLRPRRRATPRPQSSDLFVLEKTSVDDLRRQREHTEATLAYHWKYYSELAGQRKAVQDQLLDALRVSAVGPLEQAGWQRAVKYKYALHPLSAVGSLQPGGGRFNIGKLNPIHGCADIYDMALQ